MRIFGFSNGRSNSNYRTLARNIVQILEDDFYQNLASNPRPFRVLDFGGGKGELAEQLLFHHEAVFPNHDFAIDLVDPGFRGFVPIPTGVIPGREGLRL